MELTPQFWMLHLLWWPEIQKTKGRTLSRSFSECLNEYEFGGEPTQTLLCVWFCSHFVFFSFIFRAAFVNPLKPEGPEDEKLLQEGEGKRSWHNIRYIKIIPSIIFFCSSFSFLCVFQLINRAVWISAPRRCWRWLLQTRRGRSFTVCSSTRWTQSTTRWDAVKLNLNCIRVKSSRVQGQY